MGRSAKTPNRRRNGCRQIGTTVGRGPSHAGPYGLACSTCFKAKSRCVALPGGDRNICQRCHRLGKQCLPSDSIRQHGVVKRSQVSSNRIAELEDKIESLFSQLQTRAGGPLTESTSVLASEHSIMASIEVNGGSGNQNYTDDIGEREDANELLKKFRLNMLPTFPFMHFPINVRARVLEVEWPMLSKAIMLVASKSPGKGKRTQIFEKHLFQVLLDLGHKPSGPQSLDLLLAMLTYLSWGCDQLFCEGRMPRLMVQAAALAMEMMEPSYDDAGDPMRPASQLFSTDLQQDTSASSRDLFLDRRRAILGCFLLNSVTSSYIGHVNMFLWTVQMEECLASIRTNWDCETDRDFALLVRLQVLADEASQIYQQLKTELRHPVNESATSKATVQLALLQIELQGLRASLPLHASRRALAMAHLYSVESRLGQMNHAVFSAVPIMICQFDRMMTSISTGESIVDGTAKTKTARTDHMVSLWQCLQSSMDCVWKLLDLELEMFGHLSALQLSQLDQSLACLHCLTSTFEDQGWDRQAVRTRVDMPAILDRIVQKMDWAAKKSEIHYDENTFSHLKRKICKLQNSLTNSPAQSHTAQREAVAAWERLKVNGGGRGASPCNANRLEDSFNRMRGPFDYVFG